MLNIVQAAPATIVTAIVTFAPAANSQDFLEEVFHVAWPTISDEVICNAERRPACNRRDELVRICSAFPAGLEKRKNSRADYAEGVP